MDDPYQPPKAAIRIPRRARPLKWTQILFSFDARIPRRTYWAVQLAIAAVGVGVGVAWAFIGVEGIFLYFPFALLAFWVDLAVTVKRWHDLGKSGGWAFLMLVPIVGPLWTFIECGFFRGTVGRNTYGRDPT
jgi:uncharacterized membrane protein YhaH (DUF805 family)